MRSLISLVNDNHVDDNLKEMLVYVLQNNENVPSISSTLKTP